MKRQLWFFLCLGFLGGWGSRGLYDHPNQWQGWAILELPALLLALAGVLWYLAHRLSRTPHN